MTSSEVSYMLLLYQTTAANGGTLIALRTRSSRSMKHSTNKLRRQVWGNLGRVGLLAIGKDNSRTWQWVIACAASSTVWTSALLILFCESNLLFVKFEETIIKL